MKEISSILLDVGSDKMDDTLKMHYEERIQLT